MRTVSRGRTGGSTFTRKAGDRHEPALVKTAPGLPAAPRSLSVEPTDLKGVRLNLAFESGLAAVTSLVAPSRLGRAALEESVLSRAVEVIGDRAQAMRWMGTPVRALGYATPVSLLATKAGMSAVLTVLSRLEHGVL